MAMQATTSYIAGYKMAHLVVRQLPATYNYILYYYLYMAHTDSWEKNEKKISIALYVLVVHTQTGEEKRYRISWLGE